MHLLIYRKRPDVNAVVHAHPPTATGFAAAGMALDRALCSEIIVTLGSVPLANYETPGTPELAEALAPLVGEHDAILMANHGVVTYGEDLLNAYMNMETVEHFAKIALVTHMLGKQQPLSDQHVDKLREIRLKYHTHNHVGCGSGQRLTVQFRRTLSFILLRSVKRSPARKFAPQRRISQHLVVVIIERVVDVRVGRDVTSEVVPATEIDARISRSVVDRRDVSEEKVGIGTPSDRGHAKVAPQRCRV